jgi:hypothetical protein
MAAEDAAQHASLEDLRQSLPECFSPCGAGMPPLSLPKEFASAVGYLHGKALQVYPEDGPNPPIAPALLAAKNQAMQAQAAYMASMMSRASQLSIAERAKCSHWIVAHMVATRDVSGV